MIKLANLGYLVLDAEDPHAWRSFGTAILGMMSVPGNGDDGVCFLKIDDAPHRLIVRPADATRLAAAGWEVADADALAGVSAQLRAAGREVAEGDADGARLRAVTAYISTTDPAGNVVEVFYGRDQDDTAFVSPAGVSRFVTGEMGLGHVVIPAPNIDETHNFYRDTLGFGDSDNLTLPAPAEGVPDMNIRFLHADNPRHHSLALFNFPNPIGIVHLMVEVTSLDEVGCALDRVEQAGIPLMSSLGRHCNDNMLSFYAIAPGGVAVEYGYDGLQLDWDTFEPTVSTEGDIWGHHYATPEV